MLDLRRWRGRWVLRSGVRAWIDLGPSTLTRGAAAELARGLLAAGLVKGARHGGANPGIARNSSPCTCGDCSVGCEFRALRAARRKEAA